MALPATRSSSTFERFLEAAEALGLTREKQARLLGLKRETYFRRLRAGALKNSEAAAAQLLPLALERVTTLYGDPERARNWLLHPNRALDNERPIDLLATPEGYEEVISTCEEAVYGFY